MKPVLSFIFIAFMMVCGTLSLSANASADYQQLTKDYVEFLNGEHPELNLWVHSRGFQAYQELEILDLEMERLQVEPHVGFQVPKDSLKQLSCSKIVCGGGGGSCPTCYHSNTQPSPSQQW